MNEKSGCAAVAVKTVLVALYQTKNRVVKGQQLTIWLVIWPFFASYPRAIAPFLNPSKA